jgi:hypothetical protein
MLLIWRDSERSFRSKTKESPSLAPVNLRGINIMAIPMRVEPSCPSEAGMEVNLNVAANFSLNVCSRISKRLPSFTDRRQMQHRAIFDQPLYFGSVVRPVRITSTICPFKHVFLGRNYAATM